MGERRRSSFPAAASGGDLEQRWGAGPGGGEEEANPFSFKEFVRSKDRSGAAAGAPRLRGQSGGRASPKEFPRLSLLLDEEDSSSESPSLEFQEPFFPAPTAMSSLLDDDDDDWSSTYQPSAVEEAALSTSACDSLDLALPHLQPFSPWRPAGNGSILPGPLGQGDDGPTVGGGLFSPLSVEELIQENSTLRSKIVHLEAASEVQAQRVKELERTLAESRRKEARETHDLEAMVQQVEENLQLMTKRALKAESGTMKLKQENAVLQVQVQNFKLENEALRSGHMANLAAVKQNADAALQNLLAVIARSRSSFKQLISGAEELQLVAELLKAIDKISEMPQDSL